MQNYTVLIDQLEDQLIDHPDDKTRQQLSAENLDEAFQKKLNERAEQIANQHIIFQDTEDGTDELETSLGKNEPPVTIKNILAYEHLELESFETQISEWFVYHDYKVLQLDLLIQNADQSVLKKSITKLEEQIKISGTGDLDLWRALLYHAFGEYGNCTTKSEQQSAMQKNILELHKIGLTKVICLAFNRLTSNKDTPVDDQILFIVITNLYLIVVTSLHSTSDMQDDISSILHDHDILSGLFSFVCLSHNRGILQHRIRNLLKLTKETISLQFGGKSRIKSAKDFLNMLHGLNAKDNERLLTCAPLQYFTIRENLMDKYPLHSLQHQNEPLNLEDRYSRFMAAFSFSNTLSNLLENPRPNRAHSAQSQLPAQTVHIATPTPTAPSVASDFMSGGEKIRKLYQINQGMPFIYPTEDLESVSKAIDEAYALFNNAVKEDLNSQQIWNERQQFMKHERGFAIDTTDQDLFTYSEELLDQYPKNRDEIRSLLRVESFYQSCFADMHEFVSILIEVIKINKIEYPLNFAEHELNKSCQGETHYDNVSADKLNIYIQKEVEIVAAKEIALKAICAIVDSLLSWFKVSHVLKSYQLSMIIYDHQFFEAVFDYLTNCFDNSNIQFQDPTKDQGAWLYQNRLLNPQIQLPDFNFFNVCLKNRPKNSFFKFINNVPLHELPISKTTNERTIEVFNYNICTTIENMLRITDGVLIENMSQIVFALNELKPTDVLKAITTNYQNDRINTPILNILKKLVPYQGRKWKASNMDLISLIYLKSNLNLKDDWLSGKDLESDFNTAYEQELALRSLLQFFNMRHYPKQMELLGFEQSKEDRTDVELDDNYV